MSNVTNLSRVVHALSVQRLTKGFRLKTHALLACNGARFLHTNFSSSRTFPRHRLECTTRYTSSSAEEEEEEEEEEDTVRIGCASGFWGDTAVSVPQLIYSGKIDYLVFDYLSEITMSLLTVAKTKMPNMGYAPDFVQAAIVPFIHDIHKKGIRVVSNAGGVNPLACAAAIQEVVKKAGLDLKVAVVTGDDLMAQKDSLSEVRMADGVSRSKLPTTVHSMNAYLGAVPIQKCLDLGADIVVTGRCVDSAVALGPLMHSVGYFVCVCTHPSCVHICSCNSQNTLLRPWGTDNTDFKHLFFCYIESFCGFKTTMTCWQLGGKHTHFCYFLCFLA
uniref:Acyclic terpene utilisation N-terminal domain-containing protein n=1 Tax=Hucho hucho TaxID=62062 RepID=A0A4W5Q8W2_9TELE